jgi:SH3 domain-containing YSC84-like protein 1
MRTTFLRLIQAAGLAALTVLLAPPADAQTTEQKRVTDAAAVLETLVRAPDQGIPEHILERAEAIVVIPSLVKGGFIIGAQHGRGVMSVRHRDTNKWSAPGFIALTGGSIGWQIGVQAVDLVLLVMNAEGVKDLLDNEFKLGANASVAAGPVGRQGEAYHVVVYGLPSLSLPSRTSANVTRSRSAVMETSRSMESFGGVFFIPAALK